MIKLSKDQFRGAYTPLITPFKEGEINYDAFAKLVDHQITEGSHGIVVNGTSGEPSTLTCEERSKVLEVVIEAAEERIPVLAATGTHSLKETLLLTEHATKMRADGILVVTPYFIRPPQRGLIAYYEQVAAVTDLPLFIYHIPGRTAFTITFETLKEVAERIPSFVGLKHASTDLGLVTECINHFGPDFRIFVGLEQMGLPMLAVGATGMINAAGNIAPRHVANLFNAMEAGDMQVARQLHMRLYELNYTIVSDDTNPIPVKYMAKRMGILDENEHRLPMVPATPEKETFYDQILYRSGLLGHGA